VIYRKNQPTSPAGPKGRRRKMALTHRLTLTVMTIADHEMVSFSKEGDE
jgi:hypothetical protein